MALHSFCITSHLLSCSKRTSMLIISHVNTNNTSDAFSKVLYFIYRKPFETNAYKNIYIVKLTCYIYDILFLLNQFLYSMYMSSIGMTSLTQENWNCVSLNVLGPIKELLFLILRPWWSELLQPAKASTQHQRWDYKEFLKLCLSYLMTGTSIWCTQKTWWMAQHFYSARPPEDVTLLASWGTNTHCCVGYVGLR